MNAPRPARARPAQRHGAAAALSLSPGAALAPVMALRLQPPRLDRIVRGRAWIPVLAAMLLGIVGLRVEVLKLGSSVGTQIQQATLLQSSNAVLRSEISALSDNQRIEALAGRYGMHLPDPLAVHFVQATAGRHVGAAMRNITAPAPSTFLSGLAAEQQADSQSAQRIAALNGVATTTPASAGTGTSASTPASSSTAAAPSVTASATGGSAPAFPGGGGAGSAAGGGTPAAGATGGASASAGTAAGGAPGAASGTPAAATAPAGTSAGGTGAGGTGAGGASATSPVAASAGSTGAGSPPSAGSTNGGSGLAG
ncbi:MAG TPA: hypothetical protein VFN36_06565 [Solirubrobacteraceae bacterium]|nr:hypothetical protein [Solirubrobacteraceae bacterium]